ncbi:proline synthetase associated protein [Cyathus striatus]|nr:proline synthetase associated protein [Cyathus striatus]
MSTTVKKASAERVEELRESLEEIRLRVASASSSSSSRPTLVAVSKYKPASDIQACYENGQLDFGENYVQELVEKAELLPREIRWHFIGTLQSNKAKILAAIPNIYSIQTVGSAKVATAINKALPSERTTPLRVLLQVNTSGEETKSGLVPLESVDGASSSQLAQLACHIINECPKLRFEGLMTIGALEQSLHAAETDENSDFEKLKRTRDNLRSYLISQFGEASVGKWGDETSGKLLLSMGMSSDFEAALKAGSDIVRVGTGIFGSRPKKTAT